jgi:hypothetical protein
MQDADKFELALKDPKSLESLYQTARRENKAAEFEAEITRRYTSAPNDPLLAAWYYRFQSEAGPAPQSRQIPWRLAIPFSLVLSLIYWLFSPGMNGPSKGIPDFFLMWAPAAACLLIAFIAVASQKATARLSSPNQRSLAAYRRPIAIILGVVVLTAYAFAMAPASSETYHMLMVLHLPLLATLAVGLFLVGLADDQNSFAALHKGAEIVLTGGIIAGAAMAFVGITIGLFSAIGIDFPKPLLQWLFFGVPGLVPVIAVAITYDPKLLPLQQRFDQGFSKLIFTVARLFLPLTIIVGVIYIGSIPANFFKPFEQRDVLIIYNAMLFAVMALLAFATPLYESDVEERWRILLRRSITVIVIMAVVVSVYALSATVYRTTLGGMTANRMTVIGWNTLNIAILCVLLFRQFCPGRANWVAAAQRVFRLGMIGYAVWGLVVVLATPFLFP